MIHQLTPWAASAAFVLMAGLAVYVWLWREKLNRALEEEEATDREADTLITNYEEEKRKNAKERQRLQEEARIERQKLEAERFAEEARRRQDAAMTGEIARQLLTEKVDYIYREGGLLHPFCNHRFMIHSHPEPFLLDTIDLVFTARVCDADAASIFVSFFKNNYEYFRWMKLPILFERVSDTHFRYKLKNPVRMVSSECRFEIQQDHTTGREVEVLFKGTLTRSRV